MAGKGGPNAVDGGIDHEPAATNDWLTDSASKDQTMVSPELLDPVFGEIPWQQENDFKHALQRSSQDNSVIVDLHQTFDQDILQEIDPTEDQSDAPSLDELPDCGSEMAPPDEYLPDKHAMDVEAEYDHHQSDEKCKAEVNRTDGDDSVKKTKKRKLNHVEQAPTLQASPKQAQALPTEEEMDDFLLQMKQKSINQARQARLPIPPPSEAAQDTEDDDEQALNFKKIQRGVMLKKAAGTLSLHDEIEFKRMEVEESKRKALMQRNIEDDEDDDIGHEEDGEETVEESLFVPEATGGLEQNAAQDLGTKHTCSNQSGAGPSEAPKRRRGRPPASGKPRLSDKQKAAAIKKPKQKRLTKKQLAEQQRANNLFNVKSLGHQNLFHDVRTNNARAAQPSFTARNKDAAFKELIASIPAEHRDTAKIDAVQTHAASMKFSGKGSCMPCDGEWSIKGLNSRLTSYQMLGVSFMRERELEDFDREALPKPALAPAVNPPGGLHADQMGLGKTVMAIANIVNDRWRRRHKRNLKPTLIVAPSSILSQWKEECEKHALEKAIGKVTIYHAGQELDSLPDYPRNYGVVLASFNQVARSYPKKDPPVTLNTEEERAAWRVKHFHENKGFLHSVEWRRVILDEATAIKNHLSITSNACSALDSKFRWALTGTPAMNNLGEFYSYFRFLKVAHTSSYEHFKKNFLTEVNNGSTGAERLIAVLRPFMLRRTHKDSLLGSKLLDLPKPSRHTYECVLSEMHRKLYDVVKHRFIEKINLMSRRGMLKKQYTCVLTLLLRLRQLAGHPLLIQDTLRDLLEDEDFVKIEQIFEESTEPADSPEGFIISHLRCQIVNVERLPVLDPELTSEEPDNGSISTTTDNINSSTPTDNINASTPTDNINASTPTDKVNASTPTDGIGKSFGLKNNFKEYMKNLHEEVDKDAINEQQICVRCKRITNSIILTSCGHVYCAPCTQLDTQDRIERRDRANTCYACSEYYTTSQKCDEGGRAQKLGSKSEQKGGKKAQPIPPRPKTNVAEVINTWIDKDGFMLPSAKTLAFKAQMLNWFEEDPTCKVIVYTQFLTMSQIISKISQIEGWKHVIYNGQMSPQARAKTVKKFDADPELRLMIASLRCGGLGLNLTMATRVLIIDPWWNSAVEEQAFCRTFRRGQSKETKMMRLVAKGTVDEHMIALQARKTTDIEAVMSDDLRKKSLGVNELMSLFGPVDHDDEGNAFVYNDDAPA